MKRFGVGFLCMIFYSSVFANDESWVVADSLNKRSCPSVSCGIIGKLSYGDPVKIIQNKPGWVRVSYYRDAACKNGVSMNVISGNNRCLTANGVRDGGFAEWVSEKYISKYKPASAIK